MTTITIWRLPEVLRQTGLSRSTIYEMISRGDFPRKVKLGRRAVGWIADDVVQWGLLYDDSSIHKRLEIKKALMTVLFQLIHAIDSNNA